MQIHFAHMILIELAELCLSHNTLYSKLKQQKRHSPLYILSLRVGIDGMSRNLLLMLQEDQPAQIYFHFACVHILKSRTDRIQ